MSSPQISVVIPTRNRPEDALACARAILAGTEQSFELLFVDQSDLPTTRDALAGLGDSRIHHIASPSKGASAGRNLGLSQARAPIIALTDDDCRPNPDWLAQIQSLFLNETDAGLVCGRVRIPEGLTSDQHVAWFHAEKPETYADLRDGTYHLGISANMALSRAALQVLGPFDEGLSPGTELRAGEDYDWVVRAVSAGLRVRNVPEIEVLHLGIRSGPEVRALLLGYILSTGAFLFKHVRAGNPHARRLFFEVLEGITRDMVYTSLKKRRPHGVNWFLFFVRGAVLTYRYRVDRTRGLFVRWSNGKPVKAMRA